MQNTSVLPYVQLLQSFPSTTSKYWAVCTIYVANATVIDLLLNTTSNMTSTMTGMAIDSQQQRIQTTLTTSLNKTGSQKSSFLDVQYHLSQNDFLAIFPYAFPKDTSYDILPMFFTNEYFPDTLPPSLPSPAHYPSKGYIVQKTARLKTLFNQVWPPNWQATTYCNCPLHYPYWHLCHQCSLWWFYFWLNHWWRWSEPSCLCCQYLPFQKF